MRRQPPQWQLRRPETQQRFSSVGSPSRRRWLRDGDDRGAARPCRCQAIEPLGTLASQTRESSSATATRVVIRSRSRRSEPATFTWASRSLSVESRGRLGEVGAKAARGGSTHPCLCRQMAQECIDLHLPPSTADDASGGSAETTTAIAHRTAPSGGRNGAPAARPGSAGSGLGRQKLGSFLHDHT